MLIVLIYIRVVDIYEYMIELLDFEFEFVYCGEFVVFGEGV